MERKNGSLRSVFDAAVKDVAKAAREFPWNDPIAYANWLAQTYYLLRHVSTYETMKAAAYGTTQEDRHKYAVRRLKEEGSHDVLALNDLKFLGHTPADFPQLLETALLWQSQYYWLHATPVSHEGYVLMLEGLAAQEGAYIGGLLGKSYEAKALTFVRVHANEDEDHYGDGIAKLEKCTEQEIALTLANVQQSATLYRAMLLAVTASATARIPRKKAA